MGGNNSTRKFRKKVNSYPKIFLDQENDFASIKLSRGIEAKSFVRQGFVFCTDSKGKILEIQILNLSLLADQKKRAS